MGNCCSDGGSGRAAIGATAAYPTIDGPNDAVQLFLSARGCHGLFSQIESDPLLVIYVRGRDGAVQEVGRTEVVLNSFNPTWITKHTMAFQFEVVQTLIFRVYDVDTPFHNVEVKMLKLDEQQFLGEATCALSQIVTKSSRSLTLDLVPGTEAADSDPFLVISKIVENGIPIPICKSEVIKNDPRLAWKSVFLNIQQVGSKDSPLVIECFNFNSNGKHDLVGKVQKSLVDLERLHSSGQGENLFYPTSSGNNYQNKILKSQLFVDTFNESIQCSFLDYLAEGFELNFMVAIDFTASNGNPRLPDSLHYIDPSGHPNAYQRAVLEVGEVLQFYDTDRRFPAWGFGARPIDGPVSHCFNLNGSSNYCEVEGIQGIMMAYMSALLNVSLAGPTLFGPVITNAALLASQSLANSWHKEGKGVRRHV
ncbi:hypothetical protein CDL15_Pgr009110 [Punica granatum]|uniref:C2 domain-containing protein n=1 Tax=Punica granatum TaxID=22663 RepID=A0A218VZQ1_PUNGR|nr:hypothetical protein CDL15_Pgr009110 [Punica granatum]